MATQMSAEPVKKDFSDWLVVSDIDGTLNTKRRTLPKRNLEAITRFVCELGGHFTLASGRNVASLKKHFDRLPIASTPAIVLNGAGIYDFQREEMIWFRPIGARGREITALVLEKFPGAEAAVFTKDMIYLLRPRLFGPVQVMADHLPHRRCASLKEVPQQDWGKVIFYAPPLLMKRIVRFIDALEDKQANFVSSSIATHEMLAEGVHKGTAVYALREMLGIPYEHTAAIGDYYNDFDMLKSVFLPAACGQAPKAVRAVAKYHACHCDRGAVGDFLEYLERSYG
ncbi:MAG TPA: HAD hydrolase family protein [Candidatus Fimivicinus intestinavium]|nr:HAD hydrolase family protein [Candidatus Fimivicinus intestinavium]